MPPRDFAFWEKSLRGQLLLLLLIYGSNENRNQLEILSVCRTKQVTGRRSNIANIHFAELMTCTLESNYNCGKSRNSINLRVLLKEHFHYMECLKGYFFYLFKILCCFRFVGKQNIFFHSFIPRTFL